VAYAQIILFLEMLKFSPPKKKKKKKHFFLKVRFFVMENEESLEIFLFKTKLDISK
jgi:hypothetical protein